jgi:hypothetical protein
MLKRNLDCQLKKIANIQYFLSSFFAANMLARPLFLIYLQRRSGLRTYYNKYTWIQVQHFHKKKFLYGFRGSEYRILQKIMWNFPDSWIILTNFNWLKTPVFLYREKATQFYIWIFIWVSETDPDPVTQNDTDPEPWKIRYSVNFFTYCWMLRIRWTKYL